MDVWKEDWLNCLYSVGYLLGSVNIKCQYDCCEHACCTQQEAEANAAKGKLRRMKRLRAVRAQMSQTKVHATIDVNNKRVQDNNYSVVRETGPTRTPSVAPNVPAFTRGVPDEQRLMNNLFQGYERTVRPVRNASTPVVIRMGLTLTQIFDMDEKDQVLVTNVWLDQEWVDEFMRWDPDEFANITTLRVPCNKLWLPDIVLYNNAAEYTDGLMPANAMVRYDGNIFWPIPTKLQSSCKVDVTYFPFDEQECYMKFGSWTYDGFQVDITNRTEQVDLSNYVNNGEWELVSIRIERNVVTYSCCPEPFPDVKFYIHIRRRTLYYMYNVIFPCIMMSALTLLVFCLPPDSGEKIALGITVLLAFSVFMLAVAENLPETSEFVPLISIYLTIVMGLTSMSVIMTVFVLNLHHRGPNKRAVPRWIKEILVNKMAPYLCLQEEATRDHRRFYDNEEQFIKNVSLKITLDNIQQALQNESKIESNEQCNETNSVDSERVTSKEQEGDCLNVPGVTIYHPVRAEHTTSSSCNHSSYSTSHQNSKSVTANSPVSQTQQYFQYNPQTSQFSSTTQNIYPNPHTESASLHPNHKQTSPNKHDNNRKGRHRTTSPLSKTNEEILHSLKRILEKHEKEDRDYEVIQEWRRVAQAVDRILFFIFLLATFASTLGLLVVAPAVK
ncbi:acetylcholine receptor subunit alpha-1-A-like [Mya arenaria]|uniref:acetylcholine receptor subunit alpha-1-A-like n=1 Tax=Mya arenaria TaxID=6604 RepID=UPI0022E446F5|nr:acetylcholine receptor subunit alpha-1-A-like [Mya arenaria]